MVNKDFHSASWTTTPTMTTARRSIADRFRRAGRPPTDKSCLPWLISATALCYTQQRRRDGFKVLNLRADRRARPRSGAWPWRGPTSAYMWRERLERVSAHRRTTLTLRWLMRYSFIRRGPATSQCLSTRRALCGSPAGRPSKTSVARLTDDDDVESTVRISAHHAVYTLTRNAFVSY